MKTVVKNAVKPNTYYDSMTLLLISNQMAEEVGTQNVAVMMGNATNKDILEGSGLLTEDGQAAGSNDLILAAKGRDNETIEKTFDKVQEYLKKLSVRLNNEQANIVKTFDSALQKIPDLNLAVISIPGKYAKREALKAIDAGIHVLLFSDNVPLEDEIGLKEKALSKGLLMMGPDCGTAIINGVALGFANVVKQGDIGIIAAAGTGLQEVSTIISRSGGGISQAIGTGGRDVKEAVGGKMMLAGLKALAADKSTNVIVLISKPPAQTVLTTIIQQASEIKKPVVACFLGGTLPETRNSNIFETATLETAANIAVNLSNGQTPQDISQALDQEGIQKIVSDESSNLQASQQYIRALYTGGTLCYEALLLAEESLQEDIYSNIPIHPQQQLQNPARSQGHTFLDLGEDEFTHGRPHPMIEPALRNERILVESEDSEVAVLLLDLVLGYGAHEDPAGVTAAAVIEAKERAKKAGRYLSVVASVCGTDGDPQNLKEQIQTLQKAGVLIMPNNAQAVEIALLIVHKGNNIPEEKRH